MGEAMRLRLIGQFLLVAWALVLASCATKPPPATKPAPSVPAQAPAPKPAEVAAEPSSGASDLPSAIAPEAVAVNKDTAPANHALSSARNSADYRKDAAHHIYQRLPERIFKGKLPPMLKAVVDVHIDPSGQVGRIDWVRVPKHAPEVKLDIEQAIRQSAPFPAPKYLRQVSFTETWLWHRSGRFQLDTLTEGQN
jgi:hypothetical protein